MKIIIKWVAPNKTDKEKGNYHYHEWTKDHQRRYRIIDNKIDNKTHYEQPDSNAVNDLNEKNKFHKSYNLPKLTEEEIENENSPTSIKEIESII